jgi:hypothetical protein
LWNKGESVKILVIGLLALVTASIAATVPVPVATVVVQPKGPAKAWQLLFDNRYSGYTAPTTIGFYADLASCERVKSQMWQDLDGGVPRQKYHRIVCVEVNIP